MSRLVLILTLLAAAVAAPAVPSARGQEPLAVIVNKNNPVENLSLGELRNYCTVQRKFWSDNKRVTVVLRDSGQAERVAALDLIYRMSEGEFARYFLQAEFTGRIQSSPEHLSTGAGVRRFVFNVPGAIGLVRPAEVDATVKVVRINGFLPDHPDYPLRMSNDR